MIADLSNKNLQRLLQSPGLRGAVLALGKDAKEVVPYAGLGLGLILSRTIQPITGETGEEWEQRVDTVLQEGSCRW